MTCATLAKSVSKRLRDLRDKYGMGVVEFSIFCGLGRTTYLKMERGERTPNAESLVKIAQRTKTSVDFILGV